MGHDAITTVADERPIFLVGRQHSGNTMLAVALDRVPSIRSMKAEGLFFEHWPRLERLPFARRAQRVAEIIAAGEQPVLAADARQALHQELLREHAEGGAPASAVALYATGMRYLAGQAGCEVWAQKATSYVFYAERILRVFPGARLIYLCRNPFDIAASLDRRGGAHQQFRMILGWNTGVRRALALEKDRPDNVRLVRYEDFVSRPERSMRDICRFLGVTYRADYLDIPHVNRSEAAYALSSSRQGISTSRLYYYRQVLPQRVVRAIRQLADESSLTRLYPEIVTSEASGRAGLPETAAFALHGIASLARSQLAAAARRPRHTLARMWARLSG